MTISLTAKTIVLDLEGTTSAAGFILGDLYDYSRPRFAPYFAEHASDALVIEAKTQIIAEAGLADDATDDELVTVLHDLMARDVKSTPLKTLQGQIWADGFAKNEISSHFFDDVIPKLQEWHAGGVRLAVFSSGSIASQVPWFRHSPGGDLTPLIVEYFDTVTAGPKKIVSSYGVIADSLGNDPADLLFLTDHPEEVAAARAAGWQVVAFSRPGEPWSGADFGTVTSVSSFDEIEVSSP